MTWIQYCIMPSTSIGMGGCAGQGHSRTFVIADPVKAFIWPAKVMAMSTIDLLWDGGAKAKKVIEGFKPTIEKAKYVETMQSLVE